METSYPVFASGQVLSSNHLNDLIDYLEEQDRLTRNKLIGIGIVCGLEVSYDATSNEILVTEGVAITSEGYLLYQMETKFDKFLAYDLPVPNLEEAPEDVEEIAGYDTFIRPNGNQIPLWELLPTDYVTPPGQPKAIRRQPHGSPHVVGLVHVKSNLGFYAN